MGARRRRLLLTEGVSWAFGLIGLTVWAAFQFGVAASTQHDLDRFARLQAVAFNASTHEGQLDDSLQRGTLAVITGKMVKQSPDAMRIRTPASILGVRGTEFVVKVADPGT